MYHAEQMVKEFVKSHTIARSESGLPEDDDPFESYLGQKCIELYYAMIGKEIGYTNGGDLWHSDDNLYRIVKEAMDEVP